MLPFDEAFAFIFVPSIITVFPSKYPLSSRNLLNDFIACFICS
jgi:hypothetical protein